MEIRDIKLLLDYNNYIKECVSSNTGINKDTIREFVKGSHFYKRQVKRK